MAPSPAEQYGLGEPAMLEKIDKLFFCGVGELVDLPQIVVVGDQSSGKSSVLEALIKKPLPRDSGLCTRFATQIIFRRAAEEQITVSIIPDQDASAEHISRLRAWGKVVPSLDSKAFTTIMDEVHKEMGLAKGESTTEPKSTFSNDVLQLEISGPDQEHLSVIDVPGIFKSTTAGLTTKKDIEMVRNMVKGYMDNPRSVMLAVIPANVDVATQEILELASESDPNGDRTLGVLTKPDLVDKGAEHRVIDLIEGRSRPMQLGWHMIRNPGQLELSDLSLDRGALEAAFFRSQAPWSNISKDKVGVDSLRSRLKEVLSSLVRREFPKVKAEIKSRRSSCKQRLADLGPERAGAAEQMAYLTQIADRFQRLVSSALDAKYGADDLFDNPALRIAPAVRARMNGYSDDMQKYGERYDFLKSDSTVESPSDSEPQTFKTRKFDDMEAISDILQPGISLPRPQKGNIKKWILTVFNGNRGFEIGTFNPSIIATTMKKQSYKWSEISLGFVSDIIVTVHKFITSALALICVDPKIREALTDAMNDELLGRYKKAIANTKFLLMVENNPAPMTLNHYFNDNLQKSRTERVKADLHGKSFPLKAALPENFASLPPNNSSRFVNVDSIVATHNMSNDEHIIQDIHDILKSYYKVTRKTFVDNVTKQSINYFLLYSDESPLALFSPVFVSQFSAAELEEIAGEAPGVKRMRADLTKQLASFTDAMKILARA